MCFSAQADLVGGTVIAAIGIDAMRHVDGRRDRLLLAGLPLLLGFHQIVEAFVWWGQQGHVPAAVGDVALWVYLLIAFVVLPIYVPVTVLLLEPGGRHRRLMVPFVILGAAVSTTLLVAMLRGPVGVKARPYHLAYSLHIDASLLVVSLYVVAVCGALLFSGYRDVVIFGAVNVVALIVIAALTADGFASVWCGWAAVTSAAIALHLRFTKPHAGAPFAFG